MKEFEEYVQIMAGILQNDAPTITEDSSLYADWGLDSIQAFELIIMTEQLAGLQVPPPEVPEMYSAGDAYNYYKQCVADARLIDDIP